MSFGNQDTTFDLNGHGTTLITGENLDYTIDGNSTNGIGKTTLLNAITFVLYAKPVTNVATLDKLINFVNGKNMLVSIRFEKNGTYYQINRARKTKAGAEGNYVEIYSNESGFDFSEEDLITEASRPNVQIEKILGINYELFVRIVLFTADRNSFFDLKERETSKGKASQTSIIENLFGITELSEKAEVLKQKTKVKNDELKILKERNDLIKQEIDRHEQQLIAAANRIKQWELTKAEDIEKLEQQIIKIDEINVEHEKEIHAKLNAFVEEHNKIQPQYNTLKKETDIISSEIIKIDKKVEHLVDDKCPFCLQDYQGAKDKIIELTEEKQMLSKALEENKQNLDALNDQLTELKVVIDEIKQELIIPNYNDLVDVDVKKKTLIAKLVDLQNATNPHEEALIELDNVKLNEPEDEKIEQLSYYVSHQQFLHKLLTKKDSFVRKVLLNKNLPFLNERLSHYLTNLGMDHKIEFTHQLTVNISKFGKSLDFGNLSRGQQSRVNLALSLSFRDILQKLHTPINLCIFDEVLDVGLDGAGVALATKMLKRKAREEKIKLYIISHKQEINGIFDNTIRVIFSGGFSTLEGT